MLKFTYPIGLGLAAAVVLPALSRQSVDGGPDTAIDATLAAIDELLLISDALERREEGSIQRLLDLTQPPLGPQDQQDAFLAQLREEVGRLQLAMDGGVVHTADGLMPRLQVEGTDSAQPGARNTAPLPGTTGATLPATTPTVPTGTPGTTGAPGSVGTATDTAPPTAAGGNAGGAQDLVPADPAGQTSEPIQLPVAPIAPKPSLEAEGYNADTVRQGRLLFRANRFTDAIEALSTMEDDPEAKYWIARAYEALGNEHEAMVRYRQLVNETGGAEYIARRAQHDLSFLEWKQRFNDQNSK